MNGSILTFYSYKGGTGRSMAVANTAWILASTGLRVLAVDWDLEAPGLHRYFYPFLPDPDLKVSPGVIDLMWAFAEATMDPTAPDDSGWHRELARISPYATSINYPFPESGTVDFLPAGRQDATYSAMVSEFDWNNFYNRLGGGGFLEAMKRDMRERYDYVLIDSRTGLSDTAGICTVQLPDILVNCFSLGNQAINGAEAVAASVHRQRREGDLRIFPVPMRVEDGEQDRLDASRDYARALFGRYLTHVADPERYWGEVEIPYKSLYAYEEILATVGDRPRQENTVLAATERVVGYLTDGRVTQLAAAPAEHERRALLARFQRTRTNADLSGRYAASGPRVFISYAHESAEHFNAVRELWHQLRASGIDARLGPPPAQRVNGWSVLLRADLDTAGAILVVASAEYRAADTEPGEKYSLLGEEVRLIRLKAHRALGVVLPGESARDLPAFLGGSLYSVIEQLTATGVEPLCQRLVTLAKPQRQLSNPHSRYPTVDLSADSDLERALTTVAEAVQQQCKAEAAVRRLADPFSIPLRWSATNLPVAPRGSQPSADRLHDGDHSDLSELLLQLPEMNLVVLGDPGSGKTSAMIQLILDLLAIRPKNGPVPVLLSVGTWEPDVEFLTDWITKQLARKGPRLAGTARRLVTARAVLPVLDGLDELPIELRSLALRQLTLASGDLPMVVTSRISEYEQVVAKAGRRLSSAAVIELKPLSLDVVTHYVAATQPVSDQRWEPVLSQLRRHTDLPLTHVLSTPLMVELALTAYNAPDTDPAELMDGSRFPTAGSLEAHLFDSYIRTSYEWADHSELADSSSVSRWLAYLARWLETQDTPSLRWWQLYRAVPRAAVRALLMIAGFVFAVLLDTIPASAYGLAAGNFFSLILLLGPGLIASLLLAGLPPPRLPRPRIRVELRAKGDLGRSHSPQRTLRDDGITTTLLGLAVAVVLVAAGIGTIIFGSAPVAISAFFIVSFVVPIVFVAQVGRSAWAWFTSARFWLALRGRLPWRLMSFLGDAHRRGILRQAGPAYQFRHVRLQQQLATTSAGHRRPSDSNTATT